MERHNLELIEQPLPRERINDIAKLRKILKTPIMLDESLVSIHDAIELIEKKAVDIFNIKVMRVGGLYNSLKFAHLAQAAGIPCLVGSMVEFGIGTTAGLHFALATSNIKFACELIGPEMLASDVINPAGFLGNCGKGYLTIPVKSGLGVSLKKEFGN